MDKQKQVKDKTPAIPTAPTKTAHSRGMAVSYERREKLAFPEPGLLEPSVGMRGREFRGVGRVLHRHKVRCLTSSRTVRNLQRVWGTVRFTGKNPQERLMVPTMMRISDQSLSKWWGPRNMDWEWKEW